MDQQTFVILSPGGERLACGSERARVLLHTASRITGLMDARLDILARPLFASAVCELRGKHGTAIETARRTRASASPRRVLPFPWVHGEQLHPLTARLSSVPCSGICP